MEISEKEQRQLEQKGISPEKLKGQIEQFRAGFPFAKLNRPATPGDGIRQFSDREERKWTGYFEETTAGKKIEKFVPASGAATRMFKFLFQAYNNGEYDDPAVKRFFENLHEFPFYQALRKTANIPETPSKGDMHRLLGTLLFQDPFSFSSKPKAFIPFHKSGDGFGKLPLEEHFEEACFFAEANGGINLHFTISAEHRWLFEEKVPEIAEWLITEKGVESNVTYSEQSPSTDIVAVTPDNSPVRTDAGFLFRPGGHGALIENLDKLDADIVFIKNIDNVAPSKYHEKIGYYKKLIGGWLLKLQEELFTLQREFDEQGYSDELKEKAINFGVGFLSLERQDVSVEDDRALKQFLFRPVRVCGMVKNEGEPGGGPFWVQGHGAVSLQIVEKSQIDMDDPQQRNIVAKSTHFNPVDLVCAVKDYKEKKYNLHDFIDPETGFISHKSHEGREIKAQELPGLWNGAMAKWHTSFVEVPLITFNPVKTINDLLKSVHQEN